VVQRAEQAAMMARADLPKLSLAHVYPDQCHPKVCGDSKEAGLPIAVFPARPEMYLNTS
jgi:hypothetical protein